MSVQVGFALRGRNPDVLTCIANLSNDEVFTPPELANWMLDTLAEAQLQNGERAAAERTVRQALALSGAAQAAPAIRRGLEAKLEKMK